MPTVLCFDCGGIFNIEYGVQNPTKQCPVCKNKDTLK